MLEAIATATPFGSQCRPKSPNQTQWQGSQALWMTTELSRGS